MPRTLSHRRVSPFTSFLFGAAYYPEHGEFATIERDAQRMRAAGMNVVRMAEFAWDRIEPEEGRFDFALFDETIARLGAQGIRSILCTPTAAPPRWLSAKHPEILRVDANGMPLRHGSRQHASHMSATFREHSRAITRAMAEHFAANPHVIGWQTDNEFHCHFSEDHSPAAQEAWHAFLREKFDGDIAALNRAWGAAFWAQTCARFEDVPTPVAGKPTFCNPAHVLDYARFLSWTVARFQREQIEILRAANSRWWITHNGVFAHIDYRGAFGRDLDVLGYDVYPMFTLDPAERGAKQALGLDLTRAWTGNFLVPEHQSGPGGQAPYLHDTPAPGELRRMVFSTIARGADSLLFFRWRTCRFGAEEYWCGILDHDDVPRRRYDEVARIGRELGAIGAAIAGTHVHVEIAIASADFDNTEAHDSLPLGLPSPADVTAELHAQLWRGGYAVGCVHPADDLTGVSLFFIPHWVIIDQAWLPALESWVRTGGMLVLGARSGTRDRDNNVVTDLLPGRVRELAGVTVVEYGKQNAPETRPFEMEIHGRRVTSRHWYEQLELAPGTSALATWTTRHVAGTAAVSMRRLGEGSVVYVATYLVGDVRDALIPALCERTRVKPQLSDSPAGVEVVQRRAADKARTLWFLINHNEASVVIPAAPAGRDLITGRSTSEGPLTIEAFGVAVVEAT